MSRPTMTPALARAAGADLANRRMRAEGRTEWSEADYDAACDETQRLLRQAGLVPADDEVAS